jgi:hypothetical protein
MGSLSTVEIDFANDIYIILRDIFSHLAEHRDEFEDVGKFVAKNNLKRPRDSVFHLTRRVYVFDKYYNLVMFLYDLTDEDLEFIKYCISQKFPPERNLYHLLGDHDVDFEERLARARQNSKPFFEQYLAVMKGIKVEFDSKIDSEILITLAYTFKKNDRLKRFWLKWFNKEQKTKKFNESIQD